MDFTPVQSSSDSGFISTSFNSASFVYESTPKEGPSTPLNVNGTRKRKVLLNEFRIRNLANVLESCPTSPQFSSTLNDVTSSPSNDSLTSRLEHCRIENDLHSSKYYKDNYGNAKVYSVENTPEKQIRSIEKRAKTPSSSYIKSFQYEIAESPHKDFQEIIYSRIKPNRKIQHSPKNFKDILTSARKFLFYDSHKHSLVKIISNNVVMRNIFKYLSDGELYRLSKAAKIFSVAIQDDQIASVRLNNFNEVHSYNKENYKITPPPSPVKENELTTDSANFDYFRRVASTLTPDQTLQKCPKCTKTPKALVVANNLGQCESCGFIICLLCLSTALAPESFIDKCQNSSLILDKSRHKLGDISNSDTSKKIEDISSISCSILNLSNHYDSSGFHSEYNSSPSPQEAVKKNLSQSFISSTGRCKVLSNKNCIIINSAPKKLKNSPLVSVVKTKNTLRQIEVMEPSSPPRIKQYAVGSKQSKRNLKRLTK